MNDNEIRNAILEFLYNKAKEDGIIGGQGVDAREVSKLEGFEGIEKNIIDFNIDYLEKKGRIKWVIEGEIAITIEGIDEYERIHNMNRD